MDNSFSSLQQWLTRSSLCPWWEGNHTEELVGERPRPCSGWGFSFSPSLCLRLSLIQTQAESLSTSQKMRHLFSRSKIKVFEGRGERNQYPNMEDLKQEGILSQVSAPRVKGAQRRWGFNSAKQEKPFSPCQFANKKIFRGWGKFFFYYLNSLLCVCFLYWQCFLSWECVICRKESQRKGKGEGRGQAGWEGRETKTETNTRIQTTQ